MADPVVASVEEQIAGVTDRLVRDYAERVPEAVVRAVVTDAYRPYRSARVRQFLPVLLDRSVRERLRSVRS